MILYHQDPFIIPAKLMKTVKEREKFKHTLTDKIQPFIYTVKDNADNWPLDELVCWPQCCTEKKKKLNKYCLNDPSWLVFPGFWSKISNFRHHTEHIFTRKFQRLVEIFHRNKKKFPARQILMQWDGGQPALQNPKASVSDELGLGLKNQLFLQIGHLNYHDM